jgi:hypothetical protein
LTDVTVVPRASAASLRDNPSSLTSSKATRWLSGNPFELAADLVRELLRVEHLVGAVSVARAIVGGSVRTSRPSRRKESNREPVGDRVHPRQHARPREKRARAQCIWRSVCCNQVFGARAIVRAPVEETVEPRREEIVERREASGRRPRRSAP